MYVCVAEAHERVRAVGGVAAKRDALDDEARTYASQLAEHDAALREQTAAEQVTLPHITLALPSLTYVCFFFPTECTIRSRSQR